MKIFDNWISFFGFLIIAGTALVSLTTYFKDVFHQQRRSTDALAAKVETLQVRQQELSAQFQEASAEISQLGRLSKTSLAEMSPPDSSIKKKVLDLAGRLTSVEDRLAQDRSSSAKASSAGSELSELRRRVKQLEQTSESIESLLTDQATSPRVPGSEVAGSENRRVEIRGVEIEVVSLRLLRDKRVSMTIRITNQTKTTQFYALRMDRGGGTAHFNAKLADENQNEFFLYSVSGIGGNLRTDWIPQPYEPGESRTSTLNFRPSSSTGNSNAEIGDSFLFVTDVFVLRQDREGNAARDGRYFIPTSQVNVSLPRIKPE